MPKAIESLSEADAAAFRMAIADHVLSIMSANGYQTAAAILAAAANGGFDFPTYLSTVSGVDEAALRTSFAEHFIAIAQANGYAPSADILAAIPAVDLSGYITAAAAAILTNKQIELGSNSVSGTKAQFDTACTDGNFSFAGHGHSAADISGLPAAGALELLGAYTAAGVTSLAITGLGSSHAEHILIAQDLTSPTQGSLLLRTSTDGGSTWAGGASDYTTSSCRVSSAGAATFAAADSSSIFLGSLTDGGTYANHLKITMGNLGRTKPFAADWVLAKYITTAWRDTGSAFRKSMVAVNAIQLSCTAAFSGAFKLYGVKS